MKRKLNKKAKVILLIILVLLIVLIFLLTKKSINVGKIENGKAKYSDKIENVTKYENKIIIEYNNSYDLIDNCIITSNLYNEFKDNTIDIYNLSLKDYKKLSTITPKESYNINKALDLKLVTEDTKYTDYFAVTCGFKNKKELLKYTKAVFNLAKKEN